MAIQQQRTKRPWSQIDHSLYHDSGPSSKIKRTEFFSLSDEVILRVLSNLAVSELILCQRTCKRLYQLAGDGQIWKERYFVRFNSLMQDSWKKPVGLPSEGHLHASLPNGRPKSRDWQKAYKLQSKWSRGDCRLQNIVVDRSQSMPSSMIRVHGQAIVTVDEVLGVRVWHSLGSFWSIRAHMPFIKSTLLIGTLISLAISSVDGDDNTIFIAVGFSHGVAHILYRGKIPTLTIHSFVPVDEGDSVVSIDSVFPFTAVMTSLKRIVIHRIQLYSDNLSQLTGNLISQTLNLEGAPSLYSPLHICLRCAGDSHLIVSIAYLLSTYQSSWSLGLQEIEMDLYKGPGMDYNSQAGIAAERIGRVNEVRILDDFAEVQTNTRPHLLNYRYPFLLTASKDNTLSLFTVSSVRKALQLRWRERLWGHTSQIEAIHLGPKGRAVSVGDVGRDVRVWDLHRSVSEERKSRFSIKLWPRTSRMGNRKSTKDFVPLMSGPEPEETSPKTTTFFDEEHIFVLTRGSDDLNRILVYDFS